MTLQKENKFLLIPAAGPLVPDVSMRTSGVILPHPGVKNTWSPGNLIALTLPVDHLPRPSQQ